jgi:GNAT superfamily N-acetyltransferase
VTYPADLVIRYATAKDCAAILGFIKELAEYERLAHEVVADEAQLRTTLFGVRPAAEVLLAELGGEAVGFALFFQSYSTFLAKPGLYLEDLFVRPTSRSKGVGAALMSALARRTIHWRRWLWFNVRSRLKIRTRRCATRLAGADQRGFCFLVHIHPR